MARDNRTSMPGLKLRLRNLIAGLGGGQPTVHLAAVAPVEEITRAADVSPEEPLSDREVERFLSDGYVVLPSLLGDGPGSMNDALRQDLDRLCDAREAHQQDKSAALPHVVEFGTLGELVTHPPVVDKVSQLMTAYGNGRTDFALHHIHAARHMSGTGPSHWHQDYEQQPQVDRENLMVHVFFYMNGLHGEVGDLMVLPKSQTAVIARGAVQDLFKEEELPGSLFFGGGNAGPLPPGSAIIVHSALLHGRRQRPGGEGSPRYFIDSSYCQPYDDTLRKWPGGDNGHTQGAALGLGGAKYAHIWETSKCYAPRE